MPSHALLSNINRESDCTGIKKRQVTQTRRLVVNSKDDIDNTVGRDDTHALSKHVHYHNKRKYGI